MDNADSKISDEHKRIFDAITSNVGNIFLTPCLINGEPGSAIVAVYPDEDIIVPLFVSVTEGMVLTKHGGEQAKKMTDTQKITLASKRNQSNIGKLIH